MQGVTKIQWNGNSAMPDVFTFAYMIMIAFMGFKAKRIYVYTTSTILHQPATNVQNVAAK